jgi:hypothetical protein
MCPVQRVSKGGFRLRTVCHESRGQGVSSLEKRFMFSIGKIGFAFSFLVQIANDYLLARYNQFQENGFKPELNATDKELFDLLNGIFIHGKIVKNYGNEHILREIKEISKASQACLKEVT